MNAHARPSVAIISMLLPRCANADQGSWLANESRYDPAPGGHRAPQNNRNTTPRKGN